MEARVGDKLIGTVVDLDERDSDYGDEPYPIVTVETDDGNELACHAFHTVARNELAKQRPVVGERIGIAYHGKADGKTTSVSSDRGTDGVGAEDDRLGQARPGRRRDPAGRGA